MTEEPVLAAHPHPGPPPSRGREKVAEIAICSPPPGGEGSGEGGQPLHHSIIRTRIVAEAREWIGTPYRHQGSLKGIGADCLGLVRGVWREIYGAEPEPTPGYRPGWAEAEKRERLAEAAGRHMLAIGIDEWDAGDLLLFRWRPHLPAKHAAIASSKESMVHAQDGAAVCEVAVSPWWRRRIAFAFRFRCQAPGIRCQEDIPLTRHRSARHPLPLAGEGFDT